MNGTYEKGEQHRSAPVKGNTGRPAAIDERASSSSWNGPPEVCEPTKPAGTPASHGGTKGR